ncbi:E3 ubiquitin-protein ligase DZIP3-like [Ruditapes philippinarum]|uniref:E3 ubiquitin-protein ligase DZIP3-like n=1 Tax=Ruditapes philippinarum TaxID=129788 RepID=UPI00295B5C7A|nr:E3 ubiquitin-protein ligase DZIP3-like [Ruditapes philippinarum]
MATGGLTPTAKNRIYLFRLQILIIDGGLLVLRNILDQSLTAKGITLSVCLNQEMSTITKLKSRGVITQVQYDQLFPTVGQVPTTSTMDITLIICLLRYLKFFGLNKKFDWKAMPLSTDVTVEADICRLKAFRNRILVRRSSSALKIQQTINDFKICSLDPEEEKRVQEEINKSCP